ncbi:MAG: CopD family protein [Methylophilaceae bacterium]|tara:strand:- start:6 stop:416 length:411 start_codon:yes stop_codon:yes gene_type:complete
MLWIKAFHIIFMVTWFAGLFYLPRLFVYHAMTKDKISHERFIIMERKLFYGIMTPGAIITLILGVWLLVGYEFYGNWLNLKLLCVLLLIFYHLACLKYMIDFKLNKNKHTHIFYRWFNEVPVILLFAIVILVVIKP